MTANVTSAQRPVGRERSDFLEPEDVRQVLGFAAEIEDWNIFLPADDRG